MAESNLHLHRLVLRDPLNLQRRAREMRLPDHPYDPDYILHSVLNELVGPGRLQPFVTDPRSRGEAVLAYSRLDAEGLQQQAQTVAPPEVFGLVDWEASQGKPLPTRWPVGKQVGFRARVSPVVRGPKGHGQNGVEPRKQRPEVDAYLARCWQQEEAPDREAVYREWLGGELSRAGAAEPPAGTTDVGQSGRSRPEYQGSFLTSSNRRHAPVCAVRVPRRDGEKPRDGLADVSVFL